MTLAVIALYLGAVLAVGALGGRLFRGTGEDYFLATRTIGPFLLLMSLFGTHMTAFSLLGASGEAYQRGIGVFALMASSSAIVVPAVFFFVGTRLWALGKRHGFMTQVEFFRDRWGSDLLAGMLFAALVALLVPYLLIGVKGGGITLHQISGGLVPEWGGSLAMCAVVLAYVTLGGLRSTAWVNALQTLVFMTLGAVTFWYIVGRSGGLEAVFARLAAEQPELLVRGARIRPLELLSYTAIPLSVGMFPHIFLHWLTARSAAAFRLPVVAYPLCVAVVWLPSVLLGVMGAVAIPGLEGPEASSVLVQMIRVHAADLLAGLLGAGVFAAVMSSLDSQVLSLSTLFTRDVAGRRRGRPGRAGSEAAGEPFGVDAADRKGGELEDARSSGAGSSLTRNVAGRRPGAGGREVLLGRLFVTGVLAVTFLLSLAADRSLFRLGVWSFTGFSALFPLVVAALFWRRSTWQGGVAAIATTAAAWLYFFTTATPGGHGTLGGTGILPVVPMIALSTTALVVGSLLSPPPDPERVRRFFPPPPGSSTP